MNNINYLASETNFYFIGWKAYKQIKKKAMEHEFSWSGLIIGLSIAFFIVLASAQALNLVHQSMVATKKHEYLLNQKLYQLESVNHLNPQASDNIKKYPDQMKFLVYV